MNKTRILSLISAFRDLCKHLCESCESYFKGTVDIIGDVENFAYCGEVIRKRIKVLESAFNVIRKLSSYNRINDVWYIDSIDQKDLDAILDFIVRDRNIFLHIVASPKYGEFRKPFIRSINLYDEVYKALVDVRRLTYGYDRPKDEN